MSVLDFLPLHINAGFSFASDWLHDHCGSRFDEDLMRDPLARHAQEDKETNCIRKMYPEFFDGGKEVHYNPSIGIGVATMPLIFGAPVRYETLMYPIGLPLLQPTDNPMDLQEPNLA